MEMFNYLTSLGATKTVRYALAIFFSISLWGCASAPKSQAEYADREVARAAEGFSKGSNDAATANLLGALAYETGASKVKGYLAANQQRQVSFIASVERQIEQTYYPSDFSRLRSRLEMMANVQTLSDGKERYLIDLVDNQIRKRNAANDLAFSLDDLSTFAVLREPEQEVLIYRKTIKELQNPNRSIDASSLMKYLSGKGANSIQWQEVSDLLPTLNIRRNEISTVSTLYPEFARTHIKAITLNAAFEFKGGDRLISEDVYLALKNGIKGVAWSPSSIEMYRIVVDRLRHEERQAPERIETVTYSNDQVNIVSAALLMPRGASYMFDLYSGTTEIDYGYSITAFKAGVMTHEEIVRGKIGDTYARCTNQRIQNVFGGTTAASFMANDDMVRRCSGPNEIKLDKLRSQVIDEVVKAVRRIPDVERVERIN